MNTIWTFWIEFGFSSDKIGSDILNIIYQYHISLLPGRPWCGVCPADDHLPGLFDAVHVCKSEHKRRKQPYYKSQKKGRKLPKKSHLNLFSVITKS